MKLGNNIFNFYVTDSLGNPATGLSTTLGDWTIIGRIGTTDVATYVNSITESASGYYFFESNIEDLGNGFLSLRRNGYFVTPDFYNLEIVSYETDDLYSLFASLRQGELQVSVENYEALTTSYYKESDWISLVYDVTAITPSISGWSNFTSQLRSSTAVTSAAAGLIASCPVTVNNATTLTVDISAGLTSGLIPDGSSETNLYLDIQGYDTLNHKRTIAEFTIPIRREFNYL